MTLLDFNNGHPVTNLWIAGVAYPAGQTWHNNIDSDGEDYCNLSELIDQLNLWELSGSVVDGRWEWNGSGNPSDERGNTIYNVKAQ